MARRRQPNTRRYHRRTRRHNAEQSAAQRDAQPVEKRQASPEEIEAMLRERRQRGRRGS